MACTEQTLHALLLIPLESVSNHSGLTGLPSGLSLQGSRVQSGLTWIHIGLSLQGYRLLLGTIQLPAGSW